VLSEVDGPVGRLTLNEPARLNPVTRDRIAELGTAAAAMSERDDVRVVIVTGAGRGFCSGADLAAFRIGPRPDTQPASGSIMAEGSGLWTLLAMRQPVLAQVNGPAVGVRVRARAAGRHPGGRGYRVRMRKREEPAEPAASYVERFRRPPSPASSTLYILSQMSRMPTGSGACDVTRRQQFGGRL
jgi:Enoyl-CoA hydratase/isomerase